MKKLFLILLVFLPLFCSAQTPTPTLTRYKIWVSIPATVPLFTFPFKVLGGGSAVYYNAVSAAAFVSVSPAVYNSLTIAGQVISIDWSQCSNALQAIQAINAAVRKIIPSFNCQKVSIK